MADLLARVRGRKAVVKFLYVRLQKRDRPDANAGFEDPDPPTYEPEKAQPPGIRLQDTKPKESWTEAWEIDLPRLNIQSRRREDTIGECVRERHERSQPLV